MEEFTIFENNRLKSGNIIIIYITFVTVIGFSTSFPSAATILYIRYADEPHGKQVIVA